MKDLFIKEKIFHFIEGLKRNPKCIPFLEPDQLERLGLLDFRFVSRKITKLSEIELKVKQNKYQSIDQLIIDLKAVFETISLYVPLNDPLQNDVKYFWQEIDKFKLQLENNSIAQQFQFSLRTNQKQKLTDFKQTVNRNIRHYQSQRKKNQLNYASLEEEQVKMSQVTKAYKLPVRSTLAQKLEMIYFLKAHQANEPFIHMIGDMYGIGKQTEDEYVIKLDNSTCCAWLQVLHNNSQNSE